MKRKVLIILTFLILISLFVSSDSSLNFLTRHQADTIYQPLDSEDGNLHWHFEYVYCDNFTINVSKYNNDPHYRVVDSRIYYAECVIP